MPTFRYRALSQAGEVVTGSLVAPDASEVTLRIEYLGLIPIEAAVEATASSLRTAAGLSWFARPRPEDLTLFTGDLALLLRTGARINEALELLASDSDIGRMKSTVASLNASILSGESFGDAIARHPAVFPPIYVALARVGEVSGALAPVLETLAAERQRSEAMGRKLFDTLRYPAFLLLAAGGVMTFFLLFVLPQFAGVFKDFNAKLDPVLATFLAASDLLREHGMELGACLLLVIVASVWIWSRPGIRGRAVALLSRLPVVRPAMEAYRATLFCRNLSLLLSSGVTLSAGLRILADIMAGSSDTSIWSDVVDKVRHGGKLSEALAATQALPPTAVRTLRLGEDTGQLPTLAARVADFYEAKLQRSLDRIVGVVGPAAIVFISVIVGGLIVSVMTALLSVNQVVS
jgi:general secretion pathway protein F